jgi:hypothetical protein
MNSITPAPAGPENVATNLKPDFARASGPHEYVPPPKKSSQTLDNRSRF